MSVQGSGGAREWATRAVSWPPARNNLKRVVHLYAGARGRRLKAAGQVPAVANIYACSSPKAGSQWLKALFSHPIVAEQTGLFTLPQLDFQKRLDRPFPPGTFVPGCYFSYDEYARLPKPYPHRAVYLFRDPRELIVSGYFSTVETHPRQAVYEDFRDVMRSLPIDVGLLTLIYAAKDRLLEVESWVDVQDETVATFRLEDIAVDPRGVVGGMLTHCGVHLSEDAFEQVLRETSRESLQAKDLAQREPGSESHYRVDRKTHRDLFKPEHYAAMEDVVPGLVKRLGYEE